MSRQSTTTQWEGKWDPSKFYTGPGIIGEGVVVNLRLHSVMSSSGILFFISALFSLSFFLSLKVNK